MKKILFVFLLALLVPVLSFAGSDCDEQYFFKSGGGSWTATSDGKAEIVEACNVWACDCYTTSVTALTMRAVGNQKGTRYSENDPIASHACDATDLSNQNVCQFGWKDQPANNLRLDVTALTGTKVDYCFCTGVNEK